MDIKIILALIFCLFVGGALIWSALKTRKEINDK